MLYKQLQNRWVGYLICSWASSALYHQVQLRRQHLPAAQDAHHGGAQQHVRVAALVHRAGRPRVVHLGFGVGGVRVSDSEGDLDRLGVDEQGAAGQRNAADPQGGGREGAQLGKILHGHVGVAGFQLVVQALHQLLCSGCDYLHASASMSQASWS